MAEDWKDALGKLMGNLQDDTAAADNAEDKELEGKELESESKPQCESLRVLIDKKQRHGKTATIIEGFKCDDDAVADYARRLKQKIGTGGSARGGEILLQGDWRDKVVQLFTEWGHKCKKI